MPKNRSWNQKTQVAGFRLTTNKTFEQWLNFAGRMDIKHGQGPWVQVMDQLHDNTRSLVHVITGRLQASGETTVKVEGNQIVGEMLWDTPYAIYEAARGGNHDYLTRGYLGTQSEFPKAVKQAMNDILEEALS